MKQERLDSLNKLIDDLDKNVGDNGWYGACLYHLTELKKDHFDMKRQIKRIARSLKGNQEQVNTLIRSVRRLKKVNAQILQDREELKDMLNIIAPSLLKAWKQQKSLTNQGVNSD